MTQSENSEKLGCSSPWQLCFWTRNTGNIVLIIIISTSDFCNRDPHDYSFHIPYCSIQKTLNRNSSSHSFERNKMTIYSLYEIMCDKKAKCGSMGLIHNQKSSERTNVSLYWVLPQLKRVWNHACIDRQFKSVCFKSPTYQWNLVEAQTTEFKTTKLKTLDELGRE